MSKRELIDQITVLNPTASPVFLAGFADEDLAEYLEHLKWVVPEGGPRYGQDQPTDLVGGLLFTPAALTA